MKSKNTELKKSKNFIILFTVFVMLVMLMSSFILWNVLQIWWPNNFPPMNKTVLELSSYTSGKVFAGFIVVVWFISIFLTFKDLIKDLKSHLT